MKKLNNKKKIIIVFGTRPEGIKLAPLVNELNKYKDSINTIVCVTGQHRELLDQVLSFFHIFPHYDFNIMKNGQDLFEIFSSILVSLRDVLKKEKPDLVIVHGDTSTSTSAALASFYEKIPVVHVEAGLRTYNKYSPWPEEVNRQITSRIATYHFSPTQKNKYNLIKEGICKENIFVTGNTVIDSLKFALASIKKNINLKNEIIQKLIKAGIKEDSINKWANKSRKLILITGHRRENFGNGFSSILSGIKNLAESYPNIDFVYPAHKNPNVREAIKNVFFNELNNIQYDNIFFIEPLEYLPFVFLMHNSHIILTDSGGIQEEAPSLKKPVLVFRDTTERPEALKSKAIKLVGITSESIFNNTVNLLEDEKLYFNMSNSRNPYGNGNASKKIADIILNRILFVT